MASILIIDSQHDVRMRLSSILRRYFPHTLLHRISNGEAAQFVLDHPEIDLIICDPAASDPKRAVREFRLLQKLSGNSKILLYCSCKHTDFDLLTCLSAGASGFLAKPACPFDLLQAISKISEGVSYLEDEVKSDILRILNNSPVG